MHCRADAHRSFRRHHHSQLLASGLPGQLNYGPAIKHEWGNMAGAGLEPCAATAAGNAMRVRGQWSGPAGVWFASWRVGDPAPHGLAAVL